MSCRDILFVTVLISAFMLYFNQYKGREGIDMAYLEVSRLIKNYGEFTAVDNLSFNVQKGEVFGLIGPNGAGKSTTINIITTLDTMTKGTVTIDGLDVVKERKKVRRLIGLVPQDLSIYPYLTARENVEFFGSLYELKGRELKEKVERALSFTGLSEIADKKMKAMSGGMKRRLNIACGIVHEPQLIVMDEPTVGVDAQSRELIMHSIKQLQKEGATVIYTSHYMHEVEQICDRIAIIDHGKLVAEGRERELVSRITEFKTVIINTAFPDNFGIDGFKRKIASLPDIKGCAVEGNVIRADVALSSENFNYLFSEIEKAGLPIKSVNTEVPDLDAVFLALTGREINTDKE